MDTDRGGSDKDLAGPSVGIAYAERNQDLVRGWLDDPEHTRRQRKVVQDRGPRIHFASQRVACLPSGVLDLDRDGGLSQLIKIAGRLAPRLLKLPRSRVINCSTLDEQSVWDETTG